MTLHDILNKIGAATALVAAISWVYASLIPVPTDIKSAWGTLVGVDEMKAGFNRQARWNAIAAAVTGITALIGAVANVL